MARAVLIQLARLGDLLQSVPAIEAVKRQEPDLALDLLCPSALAAIGRLLPGIQRVLGWDGPLWNQWADGACGEPLSRLVARADEQLRDLSKEPYDRAYVLNQHPRAILAGSLLAREIVGPRFHALDERLRPWAAYIRRVAQTGTSHRVHLADAFCGMIGLAPVGRPIAIRPAILPLQDDVDRIGTGNGPWIGVLVGAGDQERLIPLDVWRDVIAGCLERIPSGRIVLCGAAMERERAQQLQLLLPSSALGRLWDLTGRTSLLELTVLLSRCRHVIGADTGPLHLAAAVGAGVVGWYFARARVHETGPYGEGHLVWQAECVKREALGVKRQGFESEGMPSRITRHVSPEHWPIEATLSHLMGQSPTQTTGWTLWESHCDRWGAYYSEVGKDAEPPLERERTWALLHPAPVG